MRELSARLARDLLRLSDGRAPRTPAVRRRDIERLRHLLGASALEVEPWSSALPLLLAPETPGVRDTSDGVARRDRARLLALASRLDPQGLDLALQHLGLLVRQGLTASADAEADRLLELVR